MIHFLVIFILVFTFFFGFKKFFFFEKTKDIFNDSNYWVVSGVFTFVIFVLNIGISILIYMIGYNEMYILKEEHEIVSFNSNNFISNQLTGNFIGTTLDGKYVLGKSITGNELKLDLIYLYKANTKIIENENLVGNQGKLLIYESKIKNPIINYIFYIPDYQENKIYNRILIGKGTKLKVLID